MVEKDKLKKKRKVDVQIVVFIVIHLQQKKDLLNAVGESNRISG